jgi:hypothetical protein
MLKNLIEVPIRHPAFCLLSGLVLMVSAAAFEKLGAPLVIAAAISFYLVWINFGIIQTFGKSKYSQIPAVILGLCLTASSICLSAVFAGLITGRPVLGLSSLLLLTLSYSGLVLVSVRSILLNFRNQGHEIDSADALTVVMQVIFFPLGLFSLSKAAYASSRSAS